MKYAALLFVASLFTASSFADTITALKARDIAAQSANVEARSKVIEIFGKKSTVSVTPNEWIIIFFDPYAKQDGRLIKVSGNSVVGIDDGYTQLDRFRLAAYKPEEIIDPSKLKIDSDVAIENLKRSTALKNVKITGAQMRLVKPEDGGTVPVWYITLFASKKMTDKSVEIGDAEVSASTGQILKLDLELKKLE